MPPEFPDYPGTILIPDREIRIEFGHHMHDIIRRKLLQGRDEIRLLINGRIRIFELPAPQQILDFVCMRDVGVRQGNVRITIVHALFPEIPLHYHASGNIDDSYYYRSFSYAVGTGEPDED